MLGQAGVPIWPPLHPRERELLRAEAEAFGLGDVAERVLPPAGPDRTLDVSDPGFVLPLVLCLGEDGTCGLFHATLHQPDLAEGLLGQDLLGYCRTHPVRRTYMLLRDSLTATGSVPPPFLIHVPFHALANVCIYIGRDGRTRGGTSATPARFYPPTAAVVEQTPPCEVARSTARATLAMYAQESGFEPMDAPTREAIRAIGVRSRAARRMCVERPFRSVLVDWLLRGRRVVSAVWVRWAPDGAGVVVGAGVPTLNQEGAFTGAGGLFVARLPTKADARRVLQRPNYMGRLIDWFGAVRKVGVETLATAECGHEDCDTHAELALECARHRSRWKGPDLQPWERSRLSSPRARSRI